MVCPSFFSEVPDSSFLKVNLARLRELIKTHLCITLTDSWRMGRLTLWCRTQSCKLGMEGEFALEGSWLRIPCSLFCVIFWLCTISDQLWVMMEKSLEFYLRWRMVCSHKLCLSFWYIVIIDILCHSYAESYCTQTKLNFQFVTLV